MVDHNRMEDSVAGHYSVTLSPERYAGLLKLKIHLVRPPAGSVHVPQSLVPRSSKIKTRIDDWKFVSLSLCNAI